MNATDVRSFLGLVRYIAAFLPKLGEYTSVLTPLTTKDADKNFPPWEAKHQHTFEKIKALVVSSQCLTVIDHENPGDRQIFVTCDVSDRGVGAMLSFGETWEGARLVAFDSMQLSPAEKNYPVHEKELLVIVKALEHWRYNLLSSHFKVYTDHRTLESFLTQCDLSRWQVRWQEFLSQYDFDIVYIKGDQNTVADALSRLERHNSTSVIAPVLSVTLDPKLLEEIKRDYITDEWCRRVKENIDSVPEGQEENGLLYWKGRLIIPRSGNLPEQLYCLTHDTLGHFGADKSYLVLRELFYWPSMQKALENSYIPSCDACQRNKSKTKRPTGPLHPLPIPDA